MKKLIFLFITSLLFFSCATTNEALHPDNRVQITVTEDMERSLEQQKFFDIKNTRDYKEIGDYLDFKITVDDEAKEIIVLYEESIDEEDYKNQTLFFPWPLKLDNKTIWTTYGYAKIYKSSRNIPIDILTREWQEHPDYKLIMRGWSLGSVMAKITARHFLMRAPEGTMIDELTTFGDIKCWFNPFYSLKKNCKKIREYTNINDVITWCFLFYRRDVKCRVGGRLNFIKLFDCEYIHTHYEECDFSKWEEHKEDDQSKVNESNSAITEEESDMNSK